MVLGLRGAHVPQGRASVGTAALVGAPGARNVAGRVPHPVEPAPARRESRYEPCEPSTSSLADLGARVTLERLYAWNNLDSGLGGVPLDAFLVTLDDRPQQTRNQGRSEDYFANVGDAIRCLRDDIPLLFQRELNYEIYREDVVFRDPRNCFKGMKNYKLIFWSLRFHGKLFFNRLYVDVKRIWQPEDGVIKMRWTVHGIPRVPWEAEGTFDGISTYRLDSHGKIYEHSVDNILLRDPPMITNPPLLAGLNLQPLVPQQPVPGAWCQGADSEEQWGAAWMQRMVASALHSLEQEPEPAAAMVGLSAAAPLPHSHQQHQQLALPGAARGQQGPACRRSTSSVSAPRLAGGSTRADGS